MHEIEQVGKSTRQRHEGGERIFTYGALVVFHSEAGYIIALRKYDANKEKRFIAE